jgi:hypothetical protein
MLINPSPGRLGFDIFTPLIFQSFSNVILLDYGIHIKIMIE